MPSSEPTRAFPVLTVVALALLAGACTFPNFQGAQIQNPPSGFLLQNDSYQSRRMFPDRPFVEHIAWIEAGNGPYSGIYINAHAGEITLEEVMAARDAAVAAAENPATTFGEVEAMTVDGRSAWGWSERLETPMLGLDWVAYRTVVSYDTISYAIEFYSGDPGMKLAAPDTLKTVISSFAIGRTEWNLPLIAVGIGALLLVFSVLRSRAREKQERLSSINLVQIPTKEEDEEGAPPGGVPESGPPSTPPPPATPSELAAEPPPPSPLRPPGPPPAQAPPARDAIRPPDST